MNFPRRWCLPALAPILIALVLAQVLSCSHAPPVPPSPWISQSTPPKKVLILLVTPFGMEAAQSEGLPHFRELIDHGILFRNATVGHLSADALTSSAVFQSGRLPRSLPFQGQPFKDTRGRFLFWADLSKEEREKLWAHHAGSSFLPQIKKAQPDKLTLILSPSPLSANLLGGNLADRQILPDTALPDDKTVEWVAKTAVQTLQSTPDWSCFIIDFGVSVAKEPAPARRIRVDRAVGNILDELKNESALKETAILLVSLYGEANIAGEPSRPPIFPGVARAEWDSMGRFWLKEKSQVGIANFAASLRGLRGLAEIYTKQDSGGTVHYIRNYRTPEVQGGALEWATAHHANLLESMAGKRSPEVVVLLLPGAGYGPNARTGGAQESIQRIPWVIWSPNLAVQGPLQGSLTLVDANALILGLLGLPADPRTEGSLPPLPFLARPTLNDWGFR